MLGSTTASRWRRASGLLFRQRRRVHQNRTSYSLCVVDAMCVKHSSLGGFVNGSSRSGFHGNPILLNCGSTAARIARPVHIDAFLFDSSSSRSQPGSVVNGRSLFSTSSSGNGGTKDDVTKQSKASTAVREGVSDQQVADIKILRTLAGYLWMKDNPEFRWRVIAALGFLVGAKVLNVQVPFLFKLAVDWLTTASGNAAAIASFTAANPTLLALFATPASVLIGYGIARSGASAFNELRTAVFSKVALRTIRAVSRKVFSHLHELDLQYHLSRETGALNRIIDRGSRAINFILSSMVFNVVPTILEALIQMKSWFVRFPTILQACESIIEMLRGQYAHSVGCYSEAAFHYIEAAKLTASKSMQAICQVYAAVSYICIGDAESSSQALDLIGPVYRMMDSFVGVREKTSVLFAYGLLLMKQHDLQEARNRLARGLQLTHNHLGNLQLVSQYLTILGSLALALHDNAQAREILKSSLTLAKKLYDIPTQIWVLSVLTTLYQELGEKGNEMENAEFQRKKVEDLQKRLADAHSSIHHLELIDKSKFAVHKFHELNTKRAVAEPSMRVDLDIPESIGFSTPLPNFSSRLVDLDTGRRGKRKL